MNKKAEMSNCCNSEVITFKERNRFVAECSYCGEAVEKGYIVEDFIPEYDGEEQ